MSPIHDILILGAGSAGFTAAIYAARANRKPVLLTGIQPGGQLTTTSEVENYPGFRESITGPHLMAEMEAQAVHQGTTVIQAGAERVDLSSRPFRVWGDDGVEYQTRALIIATGASAKWLGIPGEEALKNAGVSACATCDGNFFRNRRVIVVGGGDTAMEEALYLTKMCSEVIVVHRRATLRASKIMQDRALKHPKIRFVWNSELVEVLGNEKPTVTGVRLRDHNSGAITEMPIEGVFVAIGHQPNTEFLAGQLATDPRGYLLVEPGTTRTGTPGVFAAGDVADSVYRQAVTAAGTGCMAALDADRFLEAEAHASADEAAPVPGERTKVATPGLA